MKFEVGSKVRVLDTDQVTEVIEVNSYAYDYLLNDGMLYDEHELDWAK